MAYAKTLIFFIFYGFKVMSEVSQYLVWLDMEMTGLRPESDRVLEVALIITDSQLNIIEEAPVYVVHQPDEILNKMDNWNKSTHGKSGLIDRVRASTATEAEVEEAILAFLKRYTKKGQAPLCGNTIGQDRRFLYQYMPKVEDFLHYRSIDVTTLKELARRWRPELPALFKKHNKHQALADIHESIEELRFYRAHFMNLQPLQAEEPSESNG